MTALTASVLQDFKQLLDFVGDDGELVRKKQMDFASNTLIELNQKMTKPLKQDKKRPSPKTFPHLEVLYLCAKWLGFFEYTLMKVPKNAFISTHEHCKPDRREIRLSSIFHYWAFGYSAILMNTGLSYRRFPVWIG